MLLAWNKPALTPGKGRGGGGGSGALRRAPRTRRVRITGVKGSTEEEGGAQRWL